MKHDELKKAEARAEACYANCFDYSCVSMGSCTGHAGHEEDKLRRQLRKEAALNKLEGAT